VTLKEKREFKVLGKAACPCFTCGHYNLRELMDLPTAPRGEPWIDWIEKPQVIEFVQKFFPEFCTKMQRFAVLYRMYLSELKGPEPPKKYFRPDRTPQEIKKGFTLG